MAIRKCPQCLTQISPGVAAAYSDTIVCPGCKAPLEVAAASRHIAIWLGIAVGAVAYSWARYWVANGPELSLGWALPVVFAFLKFSGVSALVIAFFADLRNRAPEPQPTAAPSTGHGHAAGHH